MKRFEIVSFELYAIQIEWKTATADPLLTADNVHNEPKAAHYLLCKWIESIFPIEK